MSAVEFGVNYKFNSGWRSRRRAPTSLYPAKRSVTGTGLQIAVSLVALRLDRLLSRRRRRLRLGNREGNLTDAAGVLSEPYSYRVNGPVAGLFVGGNYQLGKIVLGVEGDWQWSNLMGNSQTLAPLGAAGAFPTGPFTISTTVKDYASVRGRLGFAFDRFLAFGTGGWAWGNPLTSYALIGAAPFVNTCGSSTGWTAVAGVDYAFTESVFARIEYRYTSLATSGLRECRNQFRRGAQSRADQRSYAPASHTNLAAVQTPSNTKPPGVVGTSRSISPFERCSAHVSSSSNSGIQRPSGYFCGVPTRLTFAGSQSGADVCCILAEQ